MVRRCLNLYVCGGPPLTDFNHTNDEQTEVGRLKKKLYFGLKWKHLILKPFNIVFLGQ